MVLPQSGQKACNAGKELRAVEAGEHTGPYHRLVLVRQTGCDGNHPRDGHR
jgi:hypothetical protein